MEYSDLEQLYIISNRKINEVDTSFHRYLYSKINWDNRIIGIKGNGGVGKTTLVLQHIRESFPDRSKVLYVRLDNMWFKTHNLMDLVEYHYTHGGTHIFLDEVHHLRNWASYIKSMYDDYNDLYVVYTGSSMLEIAQKEADMGRRQRVYTLNGMSFREFLNFEGHNVGDAITLDELLKNHTQIASDICKGKKILPLFLQYLQYGCYPFYKEEGDGFFERLHGVILHVLENDLPQVEDISYTTIDKIKRMLMILAERVPMMPKMSELYRELETNREHGNRMLALLAKAGLLALYAHEMINLNSLNKPDKIYLYNPNLMCCLSTHIDKGTLRETFFYDQMRSVSEVLLPKNGDFMVNREYLFEVGGKGKSFDQIKDEPKSYLAIDDIEIGHFNRIPLWLFGFLY
jgi:predicted AAA+ superfamily ATPase